MKTHLLICLLSLSLPAIVTAQTGGMENMPGHHHDMLEAGEAPGDSLYRLDMKLETAAGATIPLSSLRGQPLLVTMFYSHCTSVCPLITAELQSIDHQLTAQQRAGIRVLMVSFDSKRDTPAALRHFEQLHHIDDPRWIIARASADDVRLLATALGIRYRELPDHSFNHSAVISLTNRDGVVQARSVGVGPVEAPFMETVRAIGASGLASPADRG